MTKLEQEIAQINKDIASMEDQKEQTTKELAAATVNQAKDVLASFYKDNGLVFVQKAPAVEAGEAPPPPPSTWDDSYGGKTGESQGIVAILSMIHEDIVKDQKKAKAEEDEAQTNFEKFEKDSNAEIKSP